MTSKLIYEPVRSFSLGQRGDYEVTWQVRASCSSESLLLSAEDGEDEYGDSICKLGICLQNTDAFPIAKLQFETQDGVEGFMQRDGSDASQILGWLLDDCLMWSEIDNRFVSYIERKSFVQYPLEFFERDKRNPTVLIHSPDNDWDSINLEYSENPIAELHWLAGARKAEYILSIARKCKMITVWSLAHGIFPIIISNQSAVIKQGIYDEADRLGVAFESTQ
jgi:hypothetical protein